MFVAWRRTATLGKMSDRLEAITARVTAAFVRWGTAVYIGAVRTACHVPGIETGEWHYISRCVSEPVYFLRPWLCPEMCVGSNDR